MRILILLLISVAGFAQSDSSKLSIDRIFDPLLETKSVPAIHWLTASGKYCVIESAPGGQKNIVQYDIKSGENKILVPSSKLIFPGTTNTVNFESISWSDNDTRILLFTNVKQDGTDDKKGDYWVYDIPVNAWYKIGENLPAQQLKSGRFAPGGNKISFIYNNDIYVQDISTNSIKRISLDGSDKILNGQMKGCNMSMIHLRYNHLVKGREGYSWSPDGKYLSYVQLDMSAIPDFYMINNTETLYPKIVKFPYVKVGQRMPSYRIGVVAIEEDSHRWIKVPGDSSEDYLWQMEWLEDSGSLMLQVMNRLQNQMQLLLLDRTDTVAHIVHSYRDSAWVEPNNVYWLDKNSKFTWMSEEDGWQRIYVYNSNGKRLYALTPAGYDVIAVHGIDKLQKWLYFIASPDNAGQRYLYKVAVDGKSAAKRISPVNQNGTHTYVCSPDLDWAVHTYSNMEIPPVTGLIRLEDHKSIKVLEDNKLLHDKLKSISISPATFFKVDIGNGIKLDGYRIQASDLDTTKKHPLFYYIYGEPAIQTVLDQWNGRSYSWYQYLAQQGYVVMSIDNRGTPAPRGRGWRKAIYKQLGWLAAEDHAAATSALLAKHKYLDPDRVGIYGHSGGGQMSLNLIFRYPELYKLAMPSSFVSNQRYYHPAYQERFMGLPQDNPEGYEKGSPIHWAKQLQGKLLIIHGTGDSNVHYQTFEALINELVQHKKQFSMMAYPNRNHALIEGSTTQQHLFQLRTDFLMTNMPPGGR